MKNGQMLDRRAILKNVPLVYEGRELGAKLQAKLMLMRVAYDKAAAAFNEKMQEVLKGLKPDGFDELAQAVEKMKLTDRKAKAHAEWDGEGERPAKPSDKEMEEAKSVREEKLADYEAKLAELKVKYNEAVRMELEEECGMAEKYLTEDEYAEVVAVVKTEGDMTIIRDDGGEIALKRTDFLAMVGADFVK